jgi:hypothetical protein
MVCRFTIRRQHLLTRTQAELSHAEPQRNEESTTRDALVWIRLTTTILSGVRLNNPVEFASNPRESRRARYLNHLATMLSHGGGPSTAVAVTGTITQDGIEATILTSSNSHEDASRSASNSDASHHEGRSGFRASRLDHNQAGIHPEQMLETPLPAS